MPAHDGQICGPINGSSVNENTGVNENTRSLMMSQLVRASVLSLVCLAVTATTAPARGPYDGPWSVTIVTQRGGCQPSYRYGVEIVNGFVTYGGSGGVSMSGRVAPNGRVVVAVSAGSASANGSGRLSRASGRGNWVGRAGGEACAGYWVAERR